MPRDVEGETQKKLFLVSVSAAATAPNEFDLNFAHTTRNFLCFEEGRGREARKKGQTQRESSHQTRVECRLGKWEKEPEEKTANRRREK